MDFWADLQVHKWPSAGWILLYAICLLILFKNRKRWGMEVKTTIFFIALSIGLFLCPFFSIIVTSLFLPGYLEYERLMWLMFIGPVCAYTIVKLISEYNLKKRRIVCVVLLAFSLLISNSTFLSRDYKVAENPYKISDAVAEISEKIIDDAGCYDSEGNLAVDSEGNWVKPNVLVQEEQDMGLIGNELYYGIRQYTSAPILSPLYMSSDIYNVDGFNLTDYGLMNYEYFVCTNAKSLRVQSEAAGFELLYESEKYLLFKNMRECTVYFVRHGKTDANLENVFAGSGTDATLVAEGINQSIEVGNALCDVIFSNVYTSELSRTKKTAELILRQNNSHTPDIQVCWRLDDINWGKIEGLSVAEVLSVYPDYNEDTYIGKVDDREFVSPIESESKATVVYRYNLAMSQIVAETDGNALVVGHSSMIWYLQSMFGDLVTGDSLDNAGITVIHYDKGKWSLKCFDMSAENYE